MKDEYDFSRMKARKNPYVSKLKKPNPAIPKKAKKSSTRKIANKAVF